MSSLAFAPNRMIPAYNPQIWQVNMSQFNVPFLCVNPDPNRVLFTINCPSAFQPDFWLIWPGNPQQQNQAQRVWSNSNGYTATYHDWGPLVGYSWWVLGPTTTGIAGGWTMSYDPGLLSVAQPPGQPALQSVIVPEPVQPQQVLAEQLGNAPVMADPQQELAQMQVSRDLRDKYRKLIPREGPVV